MMKKKVRGLKELSKVNSFDKNVMVITIIPSFVSIRPTVVEL